MKTLLTTATAILTCAPMMLAQETTPDACLLSGEGEASAEKCLTKDELLGSLDLTAPANPLFTLMGATPEKTIKPKPGESFMFSYLPDAIDAFGQENTSIGIEINPGNLIMPEYISPQDLNPQSNEFGVSRTAPFGNSLERAAFLSQFTLSAAYIEKSGDVGSTQYGFGLAYNFDGKSPFFNNSDFRACVDENGDKLRAASNSVDEFLSKVRSEFADFQTLGSLGYGEILTVVNEEVRDSEQEKRFPNFQKVLKSVEITEAYVDANDETKLRKRTLTQEEVSGLVSVMEELTPTYSRTQLDEFNTVVKDCGELVTRWNRPVYGGGVSVYHSDIDQPAETMMGEQMDVPDDESGWGIWASASFASPFGKKTKSVGNYSTNVSNGQFLVSARYNEGLIRERKVDDETVTESVDGWSIGGRYVHQLAASKDQKVVNARAVRAFVEGAFAKEEFDSIVDEYYQLGIGAEFQLRKDLFFQFVIGDTFNSDIDRSTYLTGEFKWSFSSLAAQ